MQKTNTRDIPDDDWSSPKGRFNGSSKSLSIALGRDAQSTDLIKRHPFDVEILRIHSLPLSLAQRAVGVLPRHFRRGHGAP